MLQCNTVIFTLISETLDISNVFTCPLQEVWDNGPSSTVLVYLERETVNAVSLLFLLKQIFIITTKISSIRSIAFLLMSLTFLIQDYGKFEMTKKLTRTKSWEKLVQFQINQNLPLGVALRLLLHLSRSHQCLNCRARSGLWYVQSNVS